MNHCATAYVGKSTPMLIQIVVLEKDSIFELKRRKTQNFLSRYFQKTPANLDLTPKNNFGKCFGKMALCRQLKTFSFINEPCKFISQKSFFDKKNFQRLRYSANFFTRSFISSREFLSPYSLYFFAIYSSYRVQKTFRPSNVSLQDSESV